MDENKSYPMSCGAYVMPDFMFEHRQQCDVCRAKYIGALFIATTKKTTTMYILVFQGAAFVVKAYNNVANAKNDAWWHVNKFAADNGHSLLDVERDVFDNVVLQGFEVCPGHVATIHCVDQPADV